ncbi:sensor histidine kinase [Hyphomicrobium sp.]|jgi:signal transduction histidine kinase|uniref:sensor histidine kinase n=1 Tax=Hyphomicrobium sp. TaxID=82 RepID=UPI002BAC4B35|nr:histidine kinase [Hyphomicrobium sp.]HVZ03937.1 histidine kinase [Hyphomicrobium sp.]
MRLLTLLIIRLMAVVLLCLAAAIGCLVWDAHRSIESDVVSTAARVNQRLQALYWQQLLWRNGTQRGTLMPLPEWDTVETQSIISPGVCVTFGLPGADRHKLCSQVEALGPTAPGWFAATYLSLLGADKPVAQPLSIHDESAGLIVTNADPDATLRRAWREISTVVNVAIMLAAGIAFLAALMIGHALMPARAIITALKKLEEGQLSLRLGKFKSTEFNHIANAVNRLAGTLRQTNSERMALTARLFQVQEEERRSIARDLHDEFGQALTATTALATVIETNAPPDRPDIAQDARAIAKTQQRMMGALRTTLVRLRSQSIEEVGLEASLRQLITDFNAQSKSGTVFRLQMTGRLAELQKRVAIDLYRIVQECLTNASKHGRPTEVSVHLEHRVFRDPHIALTIEDDGGGDISRIHTSSGHGILGVRERLAGLGGSLSIANAQRGIRIFAMVPLGPEAVRA